MAHARKPAPRGETAARSELAKATARLGDDELRVLTSIAKRLRFGARVYGKLRVATDSREFRRREAREEIEDFLVYLACAWLKAMESQPAPRVATARKRGLVKR
jgi:hypothetical protein